MIAPRPRSSASVALRTAFLLAVLTSTAACGNKKPGGQVVAVVDNQEVTRRDLAAEPQAAPLPQGEASQPALSAVLNGVVDRKLAVAEAKRLGLDRTPQYVEQANRLEEVMLSRTLFDRWAAEMPQPDQRQIADIIARNPQRFSGRKLFLVDRIETAAEAGQAEAFAPLTTNDAIAAYLNSRSQAYRRNRTVIDSADLPLPLYRQLLALKLGDPLALSQPGGMIVLAVIETRNAPPPAAERTAQAVKSLRQAAVQEKLAGLRQKAAIAYQPGYRPAVAPMSSSRAQP